MTDKNVSERRKTGGAEGGFFFEILEALSSAFLPRTKDIVWARFGLAGKRPKTLEAIGGEYGITREHVRQIIVSAVSSVRGKRDDERFASVTERINSTIDGRNGIVSADDLFAVLASDSKQEAGALSFFLQCMRSVKEMKETAKRKRAYANDSFHEGEWKRINKIAEEVLASAGRTLKEREFFQLAETAGVAVDQKHFFHALSVSACLKKNPFGYWGFADSQEISPRGTREKARLVLKMNGQPMHFKEIAEKIDEVGLQKRGRKTHPQTVHNELIKDKHFVLVGRGLYALSDWGYKKGTVRQVITDILREAKEPMTRDDIIEAVAKVRTVKRSTVVINLNTFFEKVDKDRYTVKGKDSVPV
jgi:DNA-directed RNA polymerase delta subunit